MASIFPNVVAVLNFLFIGDPADPHLPGSPHKSQLPSWWPIPCHDELSLLFSGILMQMPRRRLKRSALSQLEIRPSPAQRLPSVVAAFPLRRRRSHTTRSSICGPNRGTWAFSRATTTLLRGLEIHPGRVDPWQ